MKMHLSFIPIAVLLASCGSSGDDTGATAGTGALRTGATQADSVMSNVIAVAGATSESTEPATFDASPGSAREDMEPSPVR